MSDIQTVLTRWGVWARDNSHLDYPHIASGFKGLVTSNRQVESCCDNNGLAIEKWGIYSGPREKKNWNLSFDIMCMGNLKPPLPD
ncbi:phage antitermination Q family protein [Yersinia intermedia]|nr:phage antitermination Q family protein [Yersinia intermedia]